MDEIFKPLAELLNNPLTNLLQSIGLAEASSQALSAAIGALLVWLAVVALKSGYKRWQDTRTAQELVHFRYGYKDVRQKRKLFVHTQGQNNSPTYEDEPQQAAKFIVKGPLIPFFVKTAFNDRKESDKFYLILADSGMGKTTFMINLHLHYHSLFSFRRKYKMKLFPFGDKDILKWIKEIKPDEARNTILLLDAFDEYKALLPPKEPDGLTDDERFHKNLDDIIGSVKDFREVVITSRTQYFPGQEDKPYELKIPRYGREGFHTLAKLYLSPFDEKEIRRYLNKKYGRLKFWNRQKKRTAWAIVKSSPKLMVRPMLLSYIDYLVDDRRVYQTTAQIYETLIHKWIAREAEKRKHKADDREKFKRDLHEYSRLLALEIYEKRKQNNLVSREEAIAICRDHNIDLRDYEITGQSLLTRDAEGNWKFAHKSILEFLLAREATTDMKFWAIFDVNGMDMAVLFFSEMKPGFPLPGSFVLIEGGTFQMGDEKGDLGKDSQPVHKVTVSDFYIGKTPVTQKQWREVMGNDPSHFKGCDDCPVESVSWHDVQSFLEKLNAKTGMEFRLLTEAEWEYAARGGRQSKGYRYSGSNNLGEVGWYADNAGGKTHPVGEKKPNELGLYDMSGNVWEWCQDWYDGKYYDACKKQGVVEDPAGPESSSDRVVRGGSWGGGARYCRAAYRDGVDPGDRGDDGGSGFRLVFVP